MIDCVQESLLSLREARRENLLKRDGRAPHVSTIWRWALHGARAYDGRMVKLETIKRPSGLATSREALVRFFAALTGPASPRSQTSRQNARSADSADRTLEEAGW